MSQKTFGFCLGLTIGTVSFWGLIIVGLARLIGVVPSKYIGTSNWILGLSAVLLIFTVTVAVIGLSRDEED